MSIIPEKPTTLNARGDADFEEIFALWDDEAETEPTDLTGWSFRFRIKPDALADDEDALDVEGAIAGGKGIEITDNLVRVFIDKALLKALVPGGQERLDAVYAFYAERADGLDGCYVAGPLPIVRGL